MHASDLKTNRPGFLVDEPMKGSPHRYGVSLLEAVQKGEVDHAYSHKNEVNTGTGRFLPLSLLVNCYGFISHTIEATQPGAYADLLKRMAIMDGREGDRRVPKSLDGIPCPFNYFHIFKSLKEDDPYWEYVPTIFDLEPGDFITMQKVGFKPADKWPKRISATGQHIMMVKEKPKKLGPKKISVNILDCSNSLRDRKQAKGIGVCTYLIQKIEGENRFGLKYKPTQHKWLKRELMIARLKPSFPSGT